jgi:3-hydroxyisobutyrate dehydrogenase-like beta-hydroxyacid dehydrogenase
MALTLSRLSLIGFGEAGGIIGADLAATGLAPGGRFAVVSYDILLDDPARRGGMADKMRSGKVEPKASLAEAIAGCEVVISAVPAGQARLVAQAAAKLMKPGQIFFEINSVSPETRRGNAQAIEQAGADYVEAAVMAPVPPQRLKVQMLLGGSRAEELASCLAGHGMNVTPVATGIGTASAIKMCRSIMIKGIEALTTECLLAARRYGAEEAVLASLEQTFPGIGWTGGLPDYLVSRSAEHGKRRSEEMGEVVQTLIDAGLEPTMSSATQKRQAWLPQAMADSGIPYSDPFSWRELADKLAFPPAKPAKSAE